MGATLLKTINPVPHISTGSRLRVCLFAFNGYPYIPYYCCATLNNVWFNIIIIITM